MVTVKEDPLASRTILPKAVKSVLANKLDWLFFFLLQEIKFVDKEITVYTNFRCTVDEAVIKGSR